MKKLIPAYLRVPFVFFAVFATMEFFIDSGSQPAFIKYPMVSVFMFVFLFLLIAIEITLSAVNNVTYHLLSEEQKKQMELAENMGFREKGWYKKMMASLTKSAPVENEGSLLLDHDYDGIKELDNNLPPWWVYLFYGCIVFAIVYMVRFEVMGGDDQEMEFKKEMAQAQIDIEEYKRTAPDLMDEKTVTLLTELADLDAGKTIYMANCAACHRADAGGQIGPNLTDEQWILGGGIKNVFHTLVNGGRDGKGMVAWKGTLKPKEMQQVSSYILSLKGSNPKDAKAPEGEIWLDQEAPKTDAAVAEVQTVEIEITK